MHLSLAPFPHPEESPVPRPAKVWKRSQNGCYYAKINGKQERLSRDYGESVEIFHRLKSAAKKKPPGRKARAVSATVGEVCDAFLELSQKTNAAKTYENQRGYLQSFCDHVGKGSRVYDLTGEQLDDWTLGRQWGESTRSAARAAVLACLRWAVRAGRITENPLADCRRGRCERRERILKADEKEKVRKVVKGGFADFLFFLEQTGCRPFSEAARVTAEMIDWEEGAITFKTHKNARKGKTRVVYLADPLLKRLRGLAALHSEGPLLRTRKGTPWGRPAACKAMRRVEARTGIKGLTVYAWRHTYITDCLAKSMSVSIVAELVGNTTRTIERFYQHKDLLRKAARDAVR
jgi:integrase